MHLTSAEQWKPLSSSFDPRYIASIVKPLLSPHWTYFQIALFGSNVNCTSKRTLFLLRFKLVSYFFLFPNLPFHLFIYLIVVAFSFFTSSRCFWFACDSRKELELTAFAWTRFKARSRRRNCQKSSVQLARDFLDAKTRPVVTFS